MTLMSRIIHSIIITLSQTVSISRPLDIEYYIPREWRGKSVEQRAALMIADSYNEGIRQVKTRRPELANVQKALSPSSSHAG